MSLDSTHIAAAMGMGQPPCNEDLKLAQRVVPRTCARCGLGPCQTRPSATAPAETTSNGGEGIMQFFAYGHLPIDLQSVSARFYDLAQHIVTVLPRNPERTVALRKLLEAKDAAVRARIYR